MIPVALGGKDYAKSAYSLELQTGRIDVDIGTNIHPIYGVVVRAPRKVGAIFKTGQATITATDNRVTIAARSGNDAMSAIAEQWRPLRTGRAFTVNDKNPQGTQYPLLQAPTLQIDAPVAITIGTTTTPQRLSWNPISKSNGYLLRLFHQIADASVLVREQQLNDNSLVIGNLKAGRYSATVSSIDESNLESAQSAKVYFRIVETILPPGAFVNGNTIRLPSAERLRLIQVEDLELSYGSTSNYFVAAPQSISLISAEPLQLRLRDRGEARETLIRLEPLDIQPNIELSPTRAVWPGIPITITITARHRDGSAAPMEGVLFPNVTINNQAVKVKWLTVPGKLSCTVDKPKSPGPWVVRVRLRDARGRDVARDFLEVAERPQ
jgi:hypothetical protein